MGSRFSRFFHALFYAIVSPPIRVAALVAKELGIVTRQRLLFGSLIAGPFLILLAFGMTFRGQQTMMTAILVLPPESDVAVWAEGYAGQPGPGFTVVGTTTDEAAARADVLAERVDVAVIVPPGVRKQLESGQHATLEIVHKLIDPTERGWVEFNAYVLTLDLNRKVLLDTVSSYDLRGVPPEVVVSPFQSKVTDLGDVKISYVGFYTPGVLALLLQHMGITLGALALVRERLLGAVELFRVAPVSALEILIGKTIAYMLVLLGLAIVLVFIARQWLGVPYFGPIDWLAATLALLSLASLGVGFAISAISRTELQAMQLAMLVLLASVFFSGFFVPTSAFWPAATGISYALPVTHAVVALQNLMLRGNGPTIFPIYALGALVVVPYLLAMVVFRRQLRLD